MLFNASDGLLKAEVPEIQTVDFVSMILHLEFDKICVYRPISTHTFLSIILEKKGIVPFYLLIQVLNLYRMSQWNCAKYTLFVL